MTSPPCVRAVSAFRHLSLSFLHPIAQHHSSAASVSTSEISHFSQLATSWWDPMGPSRILHLMNPLRHDFIASCLADSSSPKREDPRIPEEDMSIFDIKGDLGTGNGLRYLDIGCGGGIFAESLARMIQGSSGTSPPTAASILAIDPSSTLIKVALDHARIDPVVHAHLQAGRFKYENTTLEQLSAQGADCGGTATATTIDDDTKRSSTPSKRLSFDVITLFEVLEHVDPKTSSPLTFLTHCLRLLRPGGWLIGSTISRTLSSFFVNKIAAEAPWPLGVVPRGTHEWSKFIKVDELRGWIEEGLMRAKDTPARRAGSAALEGMGWKCSGVIYVPGYGWKMIDGGEHWGNYFWAVRKGI